MVTLHERINARHCLRSNLRNSSLLTWDCEQDATAEEFFRFKHSRYGRLVVDREKLLFAGFESPKNQYKAIDSAARSAFVRIGNTVYNIAEINFGRKLRGVDLL